MSNDQDPVTEEEFEKARVEFSVAWGELYASNVRRDAYTAVVERACRLPIPVPHPLLDDLQDPRLEEPDFNREGKDDGECTLPPHHAGEHASRWDLSQNAFYVHELAEYFRALEHQRLLNEAKEEAWDRFKALACVATDVEGRCSLRRGHEGPHSFPEPPDFTEFEASFGEVVSSFQTVHLELLDPLDYREIVLALMRRESSLREQEQQDPDHRDLENDWLMLSDEEPSEQLARVRRLIQQINSQVKD